MSSQEWTRRVLDKPQVSTVWIFGDSLRKKPPAVLNPHFLEHRIQVSAADDGSQWRRVVSPYWQRENAVLAHRLQDMRARRAAGETGFTLVELLVVVVIIVALAAIAVPIFLNQKGKADEARLSSDATSAGKVLASAISQGSPLCKDDQATCTTLTEGAATSAIYFDGQSVTSEGSIRVYGWDGSKWDASKACVQVTDGGSSVTPTATNTFHYKIQGGSAPGLCTAPAPSAS